MTATLISIISILIGITGANAMRLFFPKYSFGLRGNTILGVFGSTFFIKSFGRLGFDPKSIMYMGVVDFNLFFVNVLVSFIGGMLLVFCVKMLKNKMDNA